MWSMPVVLTEWENENDSANQNDVAKMTLQIWHYKNDVAKIMPHGDSCCTLYKCFNFTCNCIVLLSLEIVPIIYPFNIVVNCTFVSFFEGIHLVFLSWRRNFTYNSLIYCWHWETGTLCNFHWDWDHLVLWNNICIFHTSFIK